MTCPGFSGSGPSVIADALSAVDCLSAQTTAAAFSRLFGSDGALTQVLTLALTLYVALFAVGLLTGRTSLGLGSLSPRMMGLGLVLTFATSWVAYSQVVWTLLSAGPDWLASVLLDIKGSASQAFALRLDTLFQAVAEAAELARNAGGPAKGTTPADLLAYAALLLLLGTVGVLVTSRIALAALLAVGPVFILLSLFSGTRGLFEGWLKTTTMFALAPLFAVLIGIGSVTMLDPVVESLGTGEVGLQQAAMVFVAAAIHCALMAIALKLVSALTSGWRLPGSSADRPSAELRAESPYVLPALSSGGHASERGDAVTGDDDRVRGVVMAMRGPVGEAPPPPGREAIRLVQSVAHAPVTALAATPPASPAGRANQTARGLRPAASAPVQLETFK